MSISEQPTLGPSVGKIPAPAFDPQPETSSSELDKIVGKLGTKAREFARAPIADKIRWLTEILARTADIAPESVRAQCRAKGIDESSPLAGEEWLAGPVVTIRNARLLVEALGQIARSGAPDVPAANVRERDEGGVAVKVIPHDGMDGVLFGGITMETWLQKPVTRANVTEHQASFYKQKDPEGGVSLVLGAGNVASITPMDVLYKMFVEGRVCVLKMNPVNEYLGPFIERGIKPVVDLGYLAVVYGGADVGSYLCHHAGVAEIHITGSDKTHDAIVWGPPGQEREDRKNRNEPLLKKPISSELGNVSPVIVGPWDYDDAEIDSMGHNIAGMVANNASFNCNAAKMLVLPKGWARGKALLDAIGRALAKVPPRKAYYPGAQQRYDYLTSERDGVRKIGDAGSGQLPWTIVEGLDASDPNERNFRTEPFCAILSQTEVGSADPAEFFTQATKFANDSLWGTLSAMLFIHPKSEADPAVKKAFDAAVRDLRYGSIGINLWAAYVYASGTAPWGAHPSSTLADIQGGLGWVHNTPMFENIEKAVARGPLKPFPKPPTFPGHRTSHLLGRRMVEFERAPSWFKVPGLAMTGMRA